MAQRTSVAFIKSKTALKENELATNQLKVFNGSSKILNFYLRINAPRGWKSLRSYDKVFSIPPGDSIFIPVKLTSGGKEEGNMNYITTASLVSEADKKSFATATWNLQVVKESRWAATCDKTEGYFTNNADTSSFSVNIKNLGNSSEWYSLRIAPVPQIKVTGTTGQEVTQATLFNLLPGTDTTVTFQVKLTGQASPGYQNRNSRSATQPSAERYQVKVMVQTQHNDGTADRLWKSTVTFTRNIAERKFNDFSRQMLPFTIELRADNIMDQATSLGVNLYGNTIFGKSRTLNYRFQSFFSNQFMNLQSYRGNFHYVGYADRNKSLDLGNIAGMSNYFGFAPTGRGLKGSYHLGRNTFGVFYMANPEILTSPSIQYSGARHQYDYRNLKFINYYQRTANQLNKFNSDLMLTGVDYRFRQQHNLSLRASASHENYYLAPGGLNTRGIGGSLNYSGLVRKFNLRFTSEYGSENYTGYRGIFNTNYGIIYRANPRYTLSWNNIFYRQNPRFIDANGNKSGDFRSSYDRYEMRLSVNKNNQSHAIRAAYFDERFISIHYQTRGLGYDYFPAARTAVRFSASVFGAFIKNVDAGVKDYFTAQVRSTVRYKSFTANVRYNYGPFQAYEHVQFSKTGVNFQSININAFAGCWLVKDRLSLEPTLNYNYETLFKRGWTSLRPELWYFSKSGIQSSLYAEFSVSSQKYVRMSNENTTDFNPQPTVYKRLTLGATLTRSFGVPVPGKRFYSMRVTAFKDVNGNGKPDRGEELIENVLITLKPDNADSTFNENVELIRSRGEEVITNEKGYAALKNLPRGVYKLFTKALGENEGWFTDAERVVSLNENKEVLIAFGRGAHIAGIIMVDYNLASGTGNRAPDLSRIRVSAVDSAGHTYSALTTADGRFDLYVPTGDYRVSINQNAIDRNFVLEQNMMHVELTPEVDAWSISFQLREKERKVNIKKFKSDGTDVTNADE